MNYPAIYFISAASAILIFCFIYFRKKATSKLKVTVLLYHDIDLAKQNSNVVTVEQFEKQMAFLVDNNYSFLSLKEFLECMGTKEALPAKPVLLTFDDCYKEIFRLALPVLSKNNIKAVFFIPTSFVYDGGNKNASNMDYNDLREMADRGYEIGLHSHLHQDFKKMSTEDIRNDIFLNMNQLQQNDIPFQPVLAYPFGGRPSNKRDYTKMLDDFSELGIKAAFRVGNRINRVPIKNKFEINRVDIKGIDSFELFKMKLRYGKTKF